MRTSNSGRNFGKAWKELKVGPLPEYATIIGRNFRPRSIASGTFKRAVGTEARCGYTRRPREPTSEVRWRIPGMEWERSMIGNLLAGCGERRAQARVSSININSGR